MKVGDWVRNNNNEIFQLEELHMWQKDLDSLVKLWRPAVGEWCCKRFGNNSFLVIKYNDYYIREIEQLEPFIGQLPSFINDKQ